MGGNPRQHAALLKDGIEDTQAVVGKNTSSKSCLLIPVSCLNDALIIKCCDGIVCSYEFSYSLTFSFQCSRIVLPLWFRNTGRCVRKYWVGGPLKLHWGERVCKSFKYKFLYSNIIWDRPTKLVCVVLILKVGQANKSELSSVSIIELQPVHASHIFLLFLVWKLYKLMSPTCQQFLSEMTFLFLTYTHFFL